MPQQGSYTLQQKTFAFSLVSNAAAAVTSNFADAVTEKFNALISQYPQYVGSNWSITWGPVVYSSSGSTSADNTLMVISSSDANNGNPVYIVATAGTNSQSLYDIKIEDLDVGVVVPFGSGGASISQGTKFGLAILEAMVSNEQTIQQYLASVVNTNATLIFTGHSLGGALAPTLALDLFANQGLKTTQWANVYVYPTAGPSTGNAGFVTLFNNTFKAAPGWNTNVINSLDAVPKAWNHLDQIGGIFQPNLAPSPCITAIVKLLQLKRGIHQFFYANIAQTPFTGKFNAQAVPPSPYETNATCGFAAQELYQHIQAYVDHFVQEIAPLFPGVTLTADQCAALVKRCTHMSAE